MHSSSLSSVNKSQLHIIKTNHELTRANCPYELTDKLGDSENRRTGKNDDNKTKQINVKKGENCRNEKDV